MTPLPQHMQQHGEVHQLFDRSAASSKLDDRQWQTNTGSGEKLKLIFLHSSLSLLSLFISSHSTCCLCQHQAQNQTQTTYTEFNHSHSHIRINPYSKFLMMLTTSASLIKIVPDKDVNISQVLVARTYNPCYLGVWDQEDWGSRPAQASSSQYTISKTTRAKGAGGVPQVVECLLCKCKALSSKPSPNKKKLTTSTQATKSTSPHLKQNTDRLRIKN
jgi:hypothetical protein